MGVDLMLLAMTVDAGDRAFAHTTLEVERHPVLWPLIRSLPSERTPAFFETLVSAEGPDDWDMWTQGNTQTDGYGEPLQCVLADHLLSIANHPAIQDHAVNRAVWSYLAHLPPDTRVALYWC